MSTINITKKYTTRNGLPVRFYAADGSRDYPIHGAISQNGQWFWAAWNSEGQCDPHSRKKGNDLIPVKTWRAWKDGECPDFFIVKRKITGELSVAEYAQTTAPKVWFDHYLWVHEDGTETPCGVEE